jgi:hypothetical protein
MKKISIENLLIWAFTQELPKKGAGNSGPGVAASAWEAFADMIVLGTVIDKTPNGYGVIASYVYEGEPHADAIAVGEAVRALADLRGFDVGEGWNPFPEWTDEHRLVAIEVDRVIGHEIGRSGTINGKQIVNLVTSSAILKRGPDWRADEPKAVMVMNKGKPAWFVKRWHRDRTGNRLLFEDNGFDQKRQKPMQGAYRKWRLKHPLTGVVKARLDWQLWQDALAVLAATLAGRLSEHEILPFWPIRQPWLTQRIPRPVEQPIENAAE